MPPKSNTAGQPKKWCSKACKGKNQRDNRGGKEANKERRRRLVEFISSIKIESGCVDCGYRESAVALDFDHLPGSEKMFSIGSATARSASQARLKAEMAKCEVVCANCHRVRTHERRSHGRE